jgi:rSAM/selenodomain-associated transferase 1
MPLTNDRARVIVFAKAPRAGAVKTRLIPLLGPAGAADLHARLVERTLAVAAEARIGPIELHGEPSEDPLLVEYGRRHGARVLPQSGGDLGSRMRRAFEAGLHEAASVILVGSDIPVLCSAHLQQAARALARGDDAVFIPVEDGGYGLVGLRRCDPALFGGLAWSTPDVMAQTRERLTALGWRWSELDALWDLDRPADYERFLALEEAAAPGSSLASSESQAPIRRNP